MPSVAKLFLFLSYAIFFDSRNGSTAEIMFLAFQRYFPLLALLANTRTASAADCWGLGDDCGIFGASDAEAWAARQAFCGDNYWQTNQCLKSGPVVIQFSNPGANGQQACWDALQNIIEQCERGNAEGGSYEWNGSTYTMEFCNLANC